MLTWANRTERLPEPVGQFGWDGAVGTTAYADPQNRLVGILLAQTGMSTHTPRFVLVPALRARPWSTPLTEKIQR